MIMATQQLKQEGAPTNALHTESGTAAQRYGRPGDGQQGDGRQGDEQLAKALGWFSIGLGLAQLAAPGEVARFIGVHDDRDTRKLMRGVGLRELTSGLGILTQPRPAGWLWARVGGDAM